MIQEEGDGAAKGAVRTQAPSVTLGHRYFGRLKSQGGIAAGSDQSPSLRS